jgi:hypothetical protein
LVLDERRIIMSKVKIYTVPEGDWEALYVDGELCMEGHEIRIYDLIPHTPIETLEIIHITNFTDEDSFPIKESDFSKRDWKFEERI